MIMVLVVQICVMTQATTYTHYFLDHHQGPIVTALGTAYTSGVGLDESVYTNPAALGTVTGIQASTYSLSVIDANLTGLHAVYPRVKGPYSLGIGYKSFSLNGFEGSDVIDGIVVRNTERSSYKAMTFSVAVSRELTTDLSVGWTGSYYDESLFGKSQSTLSSQLGVLYRDFYKTNIGISIDQVINTTDNWGSEAHRYETKPNIKVGASYYGLDRWVLYGDYNSDEGNLSVGTSYQVYHFLEVYGGYQFKENYTFGCGFSLTFREYQVSMSYNPYARDVEEQLVKVAFRFSHGQGKKKKANIVTPMAKNVIPQASIVAPVAKIEAPSILEETRMEILNGCGVPYIENTRAERFKKEKLRVVRVGKAGNSNYPETKLVDWKGNPEKAKALAALLDIAEKNIVTYNRHDKNLEFTLVIGHDWGDSN